MHSYESTAVLALLQHFPCIGAGKFGDMVAGDETRQGFYAAIFVQRMDLSIGALVGHVFLDEQMAVGQRCDLRRMGDAQDLMSCALWRSTSPMRPAALPDTPLSISS